jgi:hypothetical protein
MLSRTSLGVCCSLLCSLVALACTGPKSSGTDAERSPAPTDESQKPGSDRDEHGCIGSAGYRWCERTAQCERPWELAEREQLDNSPEAFEAWCREERSEAKSASPSRPLKTDQPEYSPFLDDYPNQVFFGDTHLHTSFSADAGFAGTVLGPEDAYRFARGETVVSSTGVRAKLQAPLDFLVVADHAENLGLAPLAVAGNPDVLATDYGRKIHDMLKDGKGVEAFDDWRAQRATGTDPMGGDTGPAKTAWDIITSAADEYNDPGTFTTLIGYEWTSVPGGNNLHRNVIYRDGEEVAARVLPFSAYDSEDAEDLWQWMADYEAKTGGKVLAIPHNGNLSNGLMFDDVTFTAKDPIDRDYAERRARWEPLYEVTQMKGDGEAHPSLSPKDEFADFETWDVGAINAPEAKTADMLPREYVREAYKRGLDFEAKLGANPFKFGIVGSTDSHTGISSAEESQYFGKITILEPAPSHERFFEIVAGRTPNPDGKDIRVFAWQVSSAGLAAVWAKENTREALWDAMARKEVYATTGSRIGVRVFAGWDFVDGDQDRPDLAKIGYARGVPMGGDLASAKAGQTPTLVVEAARDPHGANLDRIQVIKGWVDAKGQTHERIWDVAVSDGRRIGADGRCRKAVGNTVDVEEATYANSIGDAALRAYWKDPNFDPGERAFYYVRVLEIPTPRWTTRDAKVFEREIPKGAPASIQERAYTTPVWYTP